ncbi:MAG: monovalent cation/H+ antiporter complex subunit F [Acidobacteriaceae bacterium]
MNPWLAATYAVGLCLVPCADLCLRGTVERRLVGLELSGILVTILLVLLTLGFHRLPFIDLALTLAILYLGATLVFVRFLEKHL